MSNPYVTVLIPTYKRAALLDRVLGGLAAQSYENFEVLVVAKPSEDGTESVVAQYQNKLRIKLLLQQQGFMIHALNIGLQNASGDIILFLDDDAIPFPNLIQRHVECYSQTKIGGVAGDILKASSDDKTLNQFKHKPSDLLPHTAKVSAMTRLGLELWNKPLAEQERCLFYLSRAGTVSMNPNVALPARHQSVESMLGRGANMSVRASAVADFKFPISWILGFTFEQLIAWHIWKKGYIQIFNPDLCVYHLEHGQSLSRNFNVQREVLLYTEKKLLYYRLKRKEKGLSSMYRATWLLFETMIDLKRICLNHELHYISGLKSTFYALVFGVKFALQSSSSDYLLLADLKRLHKR